jgi:hypothetical protein
MYFILQRGKIQIWKAICATNQGLHLRSAQLPKNIVLLTMKGYHETNFHFTGFKKKKSILHTQDLLCYTLIIRAQLTSGWI